MDNWYLLPFASFFGILLSDLIAGLAHWTLDNYPSFNPIAAFFLGWPFVSQYSMHHARPEELMGFNFWQTNSDGLFATSVLLSPIYLYFLFRVDIWDTMSIAWLSFWIIYCIWTGFTNQFHKWSHIREPGIIINTLQKLRLILTFEEHDRHHRNPKVSYCLTTGWCNAMLEKIKFWEILRHLVSFGFISMLIKIEQNFYTKKIPLNSDSTSDTYIYLHGDRGFFAFIRDTYILMTKGLHHLFADIYRRHPGTDPVFAYIIGEPAVLVRDASQISEVLKAPMNATGRYNLVSRMRKLLGINLVTAPGHEALGIRSRILPQLRGIKLRKYEQEAMGQVMEKIMLPDWYEYAEKQKPLNIWQSMLKFSSLVVFMSFLDLPQSEIPEDIHLCLNSMFGIIRLLILSPWMSPLWLPTKSNKEFKDKMAKIRKFILPYIEKQKESNTMLGSIIRHYTTKRFIPPEEYENFLDTSISSITLKKCIEKDTVYKIAAELKLNSNTQKSQTEIESFLVKYGKIDIEKTLQEIVSNLIGGSETTIVLMTFSCYHLANNPNIQNKLRNYITQNENIPLEEQIKSGYLGKFLDEVLRLSPPGVVHNRPLDKSLSFIPEGLVPWMSQVLVHRDPHFWEDPLTFNPDRFIKEKIPGSYFPFGVGDRSCPGDLYAKREAAVAITSMIKNFSIKLKENFQLELEYDVTLRPKYPIELVLTKI